MKILDSFKDKKFKYGGYATLLVAIVLAILVAVNLLVDLVPFKADLTKERLYSLSEQTFKVLDNLDQDVEIFVLSQIGKENPMVDEILKKYEQRTDRLRLTYVDPYRNPGFAKKYEEQQGRTPGENSVIVTSGKKFKSISPWDMYNYRQTDPNNPFAQEASSSKIEQVLTGTILYVTSEKNPTLYVLQGHRESRLPYEMRVQLENENYKINDLNLLPLEKVPDDADTLLVISPKLDINDSEEQKIRDFLLKRGGSAVFMMDLRTDGFPNLGKLLASYGVRLNPVLVIERADNRYIPQFPYALVPEMPTHTITNALEANDMLVLFPISQAVEELEIKKRSIKIEPLLVSSAKSYGKIDITSENRDQTLSDPDGPFVLAVAVTDEGEREDQQSKIIVTGGSFFLYPEEVLPVRLMQPGNYDFFLNCLNWLQGKEELISITPKSLMVFSLKLNQFQFYLYAGITVILIPLLILGSGLIIWIRRRNL
jgi:ABC-2 type transport system permease protein